MHVVATAGHVDHGKSTLVRALTGMEPDRWAEERRRGMTIDLGFAWTELEGEQAAFVDVPGHERFVANMLAGVGPAPAVLLVVAAVEGWMPQTEEHVRALDALRVDTGLVAVTHADLADAGPVAADVVRRLAGTTLAGSPTVAVSAVTGAGLAALRTELLASVRRLAAPPTDGPVRLWVDRSFTVRGSGTVVTGTLGAGTLRSDDALDLVPSGRRVRVRALQALGAPVDPVEAVARVAVNLRGVESGAVSRGAALVTPGYAPPTGEVDVAVGRRELPAEVTLHVGSAAVPCRIRPLGPGSARLRLARPLPLVAGDRVLLRDPASRAVAGADVLDPKPPVLRRRGAAAARARELATRDAASELARRGVVRRTELAALGVRTDLEPLVGDWLVDRAYAERAAAAIGAAVEEHAARDPLGPGVPLDVVAREVGLPDRRLVGALVREPFAVGEGLVHDRRRRNVLPPAVAAAVNRLVERLAGQPFAAPEASELAALRLGARELAAAERAGVLLRLSDTVVLAAGADRQAADVLAAGPQPFTVSDARRALATTRRVAVPLLELLDRRGVTRRLPDDRRVVAQRMYDD